MRWDSPSGPGGDGPPLPRHWRASLSEETGIVFYTNTRSGERTWVRPGESEILEAGPLVATLLGGDEDAW